MSSTDKSKVNLDGDPAKNDDSTENKELRLMLEQLSNNTAKINRRLKKMDKKILRLEKRMGRFEEKMDHFEDRMKQIESTLDAVRNKTNLLERDNYRQQSDLRGIELAMRMASLGFHGRRMEPLKNDLVTQGGALLEGDDDRVERLAY